MTKVKQMEIYQTVLKDCPEIMSVEKMSEVLGVSRRVGYKLLKEEKIPKVRVGKAYKIAKVNLLAYLKVNLLPL